MISLDLKDVKCINDGTIAVPRRNRIKKGPKITKREHILRRNGQIKLWMGCKSRNSLIWARVKWIWLKAVIKSKCSQIWLNLVNQGLKEHLYGKGRESQNTMKTITKELHSPLKLNQLYTHTPLLCDGDYLLWL